jgi:uncharacterized repeat protein (TIGR01451 family)
MRQPRNSAATLLATAVLLLPAIASAELMSLSRTGGIMWRIDSFFTSLEVAQPVSMPSSEQICTGNGLSTQPTTGTLFGVVWLNGCGDATRTLVTIDPVTASATVVGSLGASSEKVASITFGATQDDLYAVTGNNGTSPRTLFTVDPADGTMTKVCTLFGTDGHVLSYSAGLIYHATLDINSDTVLETIDPENFPADPNDPCPVQDIAIDDIGEPTAIVMLPAVIGTARMLIASFSAVYEVNVPESDPTETSFLGYMADSSKGLAFANTDLTVGNLTVTKFASKFRNKGDRYIEYNITAENAGPDAVSNVVVTDPVPSGTVAVAVGGCDLDADILTCELGTIPAGGSVQLNFTVEVLCKKCSTVFNQAVISSTADFYEYPYDNSASTTTSVKGKF